MKYELLIFDLDGTVLDTIGDVSDSANYALKVNNMPLRTIDEIRTFIGNGVGNMISQAVKSDATDEEKAKVFSDFKEYYRNHLTVKTKEYEGIRDALLTLKREGVHLALLSNKSDELVKAIINHFFSGIFDYVFGERKEFKRKPDPGSLLDIVSKYDIPKDKVMYIGDSEVDLKTAQNAGVLPCLVSWGYRGRKILSTLGDNIIIDRPEEILSIVL